MGRNTGRKKKGLILAPHQHMPSLIAWEAWRLRQRQPPLTMGQIAQRLGVGDPKNPTQIKRYVAAAERFLQTPAGQALRMSEGFITGVLPPSLTIDLNQLMKRHRLEAERARLSGK